MPTDTTTRCIIRTRTNPPKYVVYSADGACPTTERANLATVFPSVGATPPLRELAAKYGLDPADLIIVSPKEPKHAAD